MFSFALLLIVFFLSSSRRPPTSPLFPYTTLFRSDRGRPAEQRPRHQRPGAVRDAARDPDREQRRGRRQATEDRKSTRLNSSHVAISYAVFCLKKKKQKKKTRNRF